MKNFDIAGIVSVPSEISEDEFFDKFIEFVESMDGSFGGGIVEVDDDGEVIKK